VIYELDNTSAEHWSQGRSDPHCLFHPCEERFATRDELLQLRSEILKPRFRLREEVLHLRHEAGSHDALSDRIEREHGSPQLLSHLGLIHASYLSRGLGTPLPQDRAAQRPRSSTLPSTPQCDNAIDAPFRVLVARVGKRVEEKQEAYEERCVST